MRVGQNSFPIGLQGLRQAGERLQRASAELSLDASPIQDTSRLSDEARRILDGGPEQAVTAHIEAKHVYGANLKVVKASDERFETLLDVLGSPSK